MRPAIADGGEFRPARCADILRRRGPRHAYEEALSALQRQGSSVHVGGRSAFAVLGGFIYAEMRPAVRLLFGLPGEPLPDFIAHRDWGLRLVHLTPDILPNGLGMREAGQGGCRMAVSGPARAILEGLAVAPEYQRLEESYELLELHQSLDPAEVQALLEACVSAPVKRAFLHLADCASCAWAKQLDLSRVDLGEGVLELGVDGMAPAEPFYFENRQTENRKALYDAYQIWLPAGLGEFEQMEA